jgi:hypothetical protein
MSVVPEETLAQETHGVFGKILAQLAISALVALV